MTDLKLDVTILHFEDGTVMIEGQSVKQDEVRVEICDYGDAFYDVHIVDKAGHLVGGFAYCALTGREKAYAYSDELCRLLRLPIKRNITR